LQLVLSWVRRSDFVFDRRLTSWCKRFASSGYPIEQTASIGALRALPDDAVITPDVAAHIAALWKDPSVMVSSAAIIGYSSLSNEVMSSAPSA
jgi:hypothetical protein